jgi:phosphoserine aminotransferase
MTKEEKIKEVYSKYFKINWNETTFGIDFRDGKSMMTKHFFYLKEKIQKEFHTWIPKYSSIIQSFRPIELQGIENNAGWIPIKKETELPKPGSYVFICRNGEISSVIFKVGHFGRFESEFFDLKKMQATHYKLVEFPTLKPLYDGI